MPAVVTYSPTGDAYINGVLGDVKWAVNSLTYSFPTAASLYGSSYANGEPLSNFEALNTTQQAATRLSLKLYASVANLGFTEVAETTSSHADLRFAMSDNPPTAWAYFPSTNAAGGDAWFNNSQGAYDNPMRGNYAQMTFVHEIGHALGLEHAHEHFVMPQDRDSLEYTVMSYRSYVGAPTTGGYTNETWGYSQSLMMYDIAALQHMYGANYATNSGNTTYSWSPTTGEMFVNGVGEGAAGANRIFLTVWDGGGSDTYDFSKYTSGLQVNLQPGGWTTTSKTQLAKLHYDGSKVATGNIANALLSNNDLRSLIENATGGSGNDVLVGNQAGNSLKGSAGTDTLTGSAGHDTLDGGQGVDFATFSGLHSQYGLTQLADGSGLLVDLRTGSPDGSDILWGIEWFQFADGLYSAGDIQSGVGLTVGAFDAPVNPTITPASPPVSVSLTGTAANDRLSGGDGSDRLYGLRGNDVLNGGLGADGLIGGAGVDTAVYTASAAGIVADLFTGKGTSGDAVGDAYSSIENLLGSAFADTLWGGNTANALRGAGGNDTLHGRGGNDTLDGGAGNDLLNGGGGRDVLTGGTGLDTFLFRSAGESSSSNWDRIRDFVRGDDRIDLRSIDANTKAAGNQAFSFIGKSEFSGKAGQLHFSAGILSADLNGDRVADFQINVAGHSALGKGDFYL